MSENDKAGYLTVIPNVSDNEKAPKLRGFMTMETGEEYEVALWPGQTQKGGKKWSGPVKVKNPVPQTSEAAPFDDDIPF
jgi:hypothetical protein